MKITKEIGNKEVEFEFNALTPRIHKQQFGVDLISGIINTVKNMTGSNSFDEKELKNINLSHIANVDFSFLEDMSYSCAKTAKLMNGEKIPTPEKWFIENPEYSVFADGMEVFQLASQSLKTKKK